MQIGKLQTEGGMEAGESQWEWSQEEYMGSAKVAGDSLALDFIP